MGVAARIDPPTDLGHPQGHPVVNEQREGEAELVAVEGAGRLADDDRLEAPVRAAKRPQEGVGLGPALPGQRPGDSDVEVLDHDLAPMRHDQGL